MLKICKKLYRGIDIYYTRYIAIKKTDDCKNIVIANPLYLLINKACGYIEVENGNQYLIFDDSANESKRLLKKYGHAWDGIKDEIKTINNRKENDYGKDYMKINFNSEDDFPLNKPLKFHVMTIIIRSVFEKDGKLYPQVFFRWLFLWVVSDKHTYVSKRYWFKVWTISLQWLSWYIGKSY